MVRSDLDIYLYLQHDKCCKDGLKNEMSATLHKMTMIVLIQVTFHAPAAASGHDTPSGEWSRRLRGSTELHRYLLITILTFVSIPESVDRTGYFMSRFSHVSSTKQHPAVPRAAAAQGL